MTEIQLVSITIENDFGSVHTAIRTKLSPHEVMDKVLEVLEND